MHGGHTHGVEADQAQNGPVENLGLHDLADEESHPSLLLAVLRIFTILYAGAGKTWGARGGGGWRVES